MKIDVHNRMLLLLAVSFLTIWPVPVHAQTNNGLVGWWRLDEVSGTTANDSSGQGSNGAVESGVTVNSPGKIGQAYVFNGSSGYVDVPYANLNFDRTNPFTIAAWVKYTDVAGSFYSIMGRSSNGGDVGTFFYIQTSGESSPENSNSVVAAFGTITTFILLQTAAGTVPSGKWIHLVFTYDGSSNSSGLKVYINGINSTLTGFDGSEASISGTIEPNVDWRIGDDYTGDWMNGTEDEVRVYNRTLTPGEVYEIFEQGSSTHMGAEF